MGNYVVTPPFNDWYIQPLRKLGVKIRKHLDSGTFFMVFEGRMSNGTEVIVKAYQFHQSLTDHPVVTTAHEYLQSLAHHANETTGIVKYDVISVRDSMAFLVRPKFERSLCDLVAFQQPKLEDEEKKWIAFQLITGIIRLHATGLAHGDIKPSNVFVTKAMTVLFCDPAPFKPGRIDPQRPHLFYHFFTIGANSGCYIAPERVTSDEDREVDLRMADWFSLGCVLAYLFMDGKHLFDLSSIKEYVNGNFDMENALECIDEELRGMIMGMLEVDVAKRKKSIANVLANFPKMFDALQDCYENFAKAMDNRAFEFQSAFVYLKKIVEEQPPEYRCIVFDYVEWLLPELEFISDILCLVQEMSEFMRDCSDKVKLSRVIPLLMWIIETRRGVASIMRQCLFGILNVVKTVKKIPVELQGYFEFYIKVELYRRCNVSPAEQDLFIFAEFLPLMVLEIKRLEPNSMTAFSSTFSSVFTSRNIKAFRVFSNALQSVVSEGGSMVLNAFFMFVLSGFNYDQDFQQEILRILKAFYCEAKPGDVPHYKKQIRENVIPICNDIISRCSEEAFLVHVFEFVYLVIEKGLIDDTYGYHLSQRLNEFSFADRDDMIYAVNRLLTVVPERVRAVNALSFCFKYTEHISVAAVPQISRPGQMVCHADNASLMSFGVRSILEYTPQFLFSYRRSKTRIDDMVAVTEESVVIADAQKSLRWIRPVQISQTKTDHVERKKRMRERCSALAYVPGQDDICVGFPSGNISIYSAAKASMKGRIESDSNCNGITAFANVGQNALLAGRTDGSVILYDMRTNAAVNTYMMDPEFSNIADVCAWPNGDALAGVAVKGGAVGLIDLRMFMPVFMSVTIPLKRIVPLAIEDGRVAYLALGNSACELVDIPRSRRYTTYTETTPFRWVAPYEGAAVVVDDESASLVNCHGSPVNLRMMHDMTIPMKIDDLSTPNRLERVPMRGASLHRHSAMITCGTGFEHTFVTGDELGFVNVWRIKKAKRKNST